MRHHNCGSDTKAMSFTTAQQKVKFEARDEGTETFYECFSLNKDGGIALANVATASLPAAPGTGTAFFDTDTASVKVWNGSAYIDLGASSAIDWKAGTETGFYSIGIKDTCTALGMTISDTGLTIGGASSEDLTCDVIHANQLENSTDNFWTIIYGGVVSGGTIQLYGGSHATKAHDIKIGNDSASGCWWDLDNSAGRWDAGSADLSTTGNLMPGGTAGPTWGTGSGTPEAAVTAPVGSLFTRTDGGASTTLYVKESGTGNTGWVAK